MMGRGKDGRTTARAHAAAMAGLGLALLGSVGLGALGIGPLAAQTGGVTATFEGKPHRYTVTLPAGCRHEEGPGTVDAVCAPDLDPEKSAVVNATAALLLAVAAESLDSAADASVAGLLQRYTEAGFRAELPEAICGEADRARIKIENLSQSIEGPHLVYSADVVCAEVRFLQIGRRRASVRHVIGPDSVFRLVARAPAEAFEKQRPTIDAFFTSFRLTSVEKAEK
jgi:hypothetical protein